MFDINRRQSFITVGELRELLDGFPETTEVRICDDSNCWLHVEEDGSGICLDCEDLHEIYEGLAEMQTYNERIANSPDIEFVYMQLSNSGSVLVSTNHNFVGAEVLFDEEMSEQEKFTQALQTFFEDEEQGDEQ